MENVCNIVKRLVYYSLVVFLHLGPVLALFLVRHLKAFENRIGLGFKKGSVFVSNGFL